MAVEHRFAHHFQERFSSIRNTQRSWPATFDAARTLALETRRRGEPVNLIFSKSWFKHSDYLRSLPYDRLIYLDPDTRQARSSMASTGGSLIKRNKEIYCWISTQATSSRNTALI